MDERIADTRDRLAEQLMSDERLLGVLPEEATRLALDHALAQLTAAAALSADPEALRAAFETIRADIRALVDQAASVADPTAFIRAQITPAPTTDRAALAGGSTGTDPGLATSTQPVSDEGLPTTRGTETAPLAAWTETEPVTAQPARSIWSRIRSIWRGAPRET